MQLLSRMNSQEVLFSQANGETALIGRLNHFLKDEAIRKNFLAQKPTTTIEKAQKIIDAYHNVLTQQEMQQRTSSS